MKPKISVVTVTYNCKSLLEKTLDSVIKQDYHNVEYIIIDGNSSDGTIDILNTYSSYFDYYISEPDGGIYDAMNKAIDVATGEWIIFMNAGDTFINNEILSTIFSTVINSEVAVLYGDCIVRYSDKDLLIPARFFSKNDYNLPFCHQSTFVRLAIMRKYKFDVKYKIAADYNFFYRLYKEQYNFYYLENVISLYNTEGFSSFNVIKTYKEVSQINRTKGSLKYYVILFLLTIRSYLKKYFCLNKCKNK